MELADWMELRRQVDRIHEPMLWVKNLGWALATTAASAVLAIVQWLPVYRQVPTEGQLEFAYVTPFLVCLAGFCVLGAGLCFFVNKSLGSQTKGDLNGLKEAMDSIESRCIPPEVIGRLRVAVPVAEGDDSRPDHSQPPAAPSTEPLEPSS